MGMAQADRSAGEPQVEHRQVAPGQRHAASRIRSTLIIVCARAPSPNHGQHCIRTNFSAFTPNALSNRIAVFAQSAERPFRTALKAWRLT